MSHIVKGISIVIVLSIVLGLLWFNYRKTLTQGMDAPKSTKILNQMEVSGAPDFELKDLSGKTYLLSQFRGKIVILNFWASWCDPCVEEFPSMITLAKKFPQNLVILAVSEDSEKQEIKSFLKAFEFDAKNIYVVWDQEQIVKNKYATETLPESFLIDRKGKLIRKVIGSENWASSEAISYFKSLISKAN